MPEQPDPIISAKFDKIPSVLISKARAGYQPTYAIFDNLPRSNTEYQAIFGQPHTTARDEAEIASVVQSDISLSEIAKTHISKCPEATSNNTAVAPKKEISLQQNKKLADLWDEAYVKSISAS